MTLLLIFLGWLLISSLWGFLPAIKRLRQFAAISTERRKQIAISSGLLAFISGALLLYWISCYAMVAFFIFYARGSSPLIQGLTEAQVSSRMIPVTTEVMLQTIFSSNSCITGDPATCEISSRVIHNGFSPKSVLPIVIGLSIIPALCAALINWKLTAGPQQTKNDML